MTGEAHWLTLVLLTIGVVALLGLGVVSAAMARRYRGVSRSVTCPVHRQQAEVTWVFDAKARRWTGVSTCSLAAGGNCSQACLGAARSPPPPRFREALAAH